MDGSTFPKSSEGSSSLRKGPSEASQDASARVTAEEGSDAGDGPTGVFQPIAPIRAYPASRTSRT